MSVSDLIVRLLTCRPVVFVGRNDFFLLKNGDRGEGGFESISINGKHGPSRLSNLSQDDLISYDEMQLSALVSVSLETFFINSGSRTNNGVKDHPSSHAASGIYVAAVGAS